MLKREQHSGTVRHVNTAEEVEYDVLLTKHICKNILIQIWQIFFSYALWKVTFWWKLFILLKFQTAASSRHTNCPPASITIITSVLSKIPYFQMHKNQQILVQSLSTVAITSAFVVTMRFCLHKTNCICVPKTLHMASPLVGKFSID